MQQDNELKKILQEELMVQPGLQFTDDIMAQLQKKSQLISLFRLVNNKYVTTFIGVWVMIALCVFALSNTTIIIELYDGLRLPFNLNAQWLFSYVFAFWILLMFSLMVNKGADKNAPEQTRMI